MKLVYKKTLRSVLLSTFLVLFSMVSFSATYHVSNTENDSNSGLTAALAWKTLNKVNSFKPQAGDQILFKRGDAWEGTLTPSTSGGSGSPIVYGAYGSGDNPKIYGSTMITGWSLHSGNIYKATFNTPINQLFVNDQRMKIARYPNSGYFDINSVQSGTQFTSTELSGSINYTGAVWTGRTAAWALDTKTVTASSSKSITLAGAPGYALGVGEGFFLCNKMEFLDSAGEWYYNATTKTVYLWTINGNSPSNYSVRGSVINDGLYIDTKNYITVENLQFLQHSNIGITANNCDFLKIDNCIILHPDMIGLTTINTSSNNNTITNNVINGANHYGMQLSGSNNTITDNLVLNIALHENLGISGMGGINRGSAITMFGGYNYNSPVNNNIFRYNRVIGFGGQGIDFFNATNTIVEYNYIKDGCLLFDDAAAIYTFNVDLSKQSCAGSIIRYNIIDNIIGNKDGYPMAKSFGSGIYMDERSRDIIVEHNTISRCNGYGIYLHDTKNVNVNNNTIFDSSGGFRVTHTHGGNLFNSNILVNKASTVWGDGSAVRTTLLNPSHTSTVKMNHNKYVDHHRANSFNRADIFTYLTFSNWKTVMGQDANSTFDNSALGAGETENLFYNETKQPKTFNLGTTVYKDLQGNQVTKSITLQPFTSKVLIGKSFTSTPNDTEKPVITGFVIPATSTSLTVSLTSISATDNMGVAGYLVSESSSTPLATATSWTSTKPTSYVFSSVGSKTLYAWAKDAEGNISASMNSGVNITLTPEPHNPPVLSEDYSTYLFEETSGTTVIDSSSTYHGNTVGSISKVTGKIGKGLSLTGTGYVNLGPVYENIQDGLTLSAWIKPIASSGYQGVVFHGGPNTDTFALYLNSDLGIVGFKTSGTNTGAWITVANSSIWDGSWHHLSATYDGSKKIIYLDAVPIITVSATGVINSGSGYNLLIGAGRDENPVPSSYLYRGLIDEVRIHPYALNSSQISSLFNSIPAVVASTFNFSGPSSGKVNSASSSFTVAPNKLYTGTITLTPSGTGSAGVSPKVLAFSNSSTAQTFTITPTVAGSITFTASNNGALSNPASLIYKVIAPTENGATSYLGYNVKGKKVHSVEGGSINAIQMTSGSSFTATTMHISIAPFKGKIKGAIYSDNGGKPGTKLGETVELTNTTTGGFQKLTGLNVPISQGTKYWLAIWSNVKYNIDCETSGGIMRYRFGSYASWPNTLNLDNKSNLKFSMYVTGGLKSASLGIMAWEPINNEDLLESVKIDVYPNPSVGNITVRFSSLPEEGSRIDILDIAGRKVASRIITGWSEEFNLDHQPAGLYLVKTMIGLNQTINKLIIK